MLPGAGRDRLREPLLALVSDCVVGVCVEKFTHGEPVGDVTRDCQCIFEGRRGWMTNIAHTPLPVPMSRICFGSFPIGDRKSGF